MMAEFLVILTFIAALYLAPIRCLRCLDDREGSGRAAFIWFAALLAAGLFVAFLK